MNEENANNTVSQPTVAQTANVTETPTTPVVSQEPISNAQTQAPVAAQPQVAQPVMETPVQATEVPQVQAAVQPASEVVPQPQTIPQPASEVVPQPQNVPQPASAVAPTPAPTEEKTDSIVPQVAPQEIAPVAPQGETIQPAPALNPIANNPEVPTTPVATPQPTTNPVVAPSNPLNSDIDSNVGFVAVGENLKKKKNVPLITVITLVLLAGLGALGYFVVYPFVVNQLTKPDKVYSAVIDTAFKQLNTTTQTISHSRATYSAELSIDTNIEKIKDLAGYVYSGNFGIDSENKNIQLGVNIKDADSQEHSANIFVKGDRQYLRLSSYRELIYLGSTSEYKETWDNLYDIFEDINQDDSEYIMSTFQRLLKESIVQSKLSKEEASATINGKTYKVLNNKYVIDNDTLTSMYNSIMEGFKNDDKAIEIFARNYGSEKEEFLKKLDELKTPEKFLEDDEVYYLNIYTYSVKTTVVGIELTDGNNFIKYYSMNGYFEFKVNITEEDIETGKEKVTDLTAKGVKDNGKTNITVTMEETEIAKFVVNAWDEKNIDFTYEIMLEDQTITGEIKLKCDINDDRAKYDFKGSVKIDKDYLDVSLSITNDWTSEVANVNAAQAKTLDDAELQAKENEFFTTLENTPLAKIFTTTSGEFDDSIFKFRSDTGVGIDNCSPGLNCIDTTEPTEDPVEEDHTYHFTDDDGGNI